MLYFSLNSTLTFLPSHIHYTIFNYIVFVLCQIIIYINSIHLYFLLSVSLPVHLSSRKDVLCNIWNQLSNSLSSITNGEKSKGLTVLEDDVMNFTVDRSFSASCLHATSLFYISSISSLTTYTPFLFRNSKILLLSLCYFNFLRYSETQIYFQLLVSVSLFSPFLPISNTSTTCICSLLHHVMLRFSYVRIYLCS